MGTLDTSTAALRVVDIQNRLTREPLSAGQRSFLLAEQREIWDAALPGRPFETVAQLARYAA